MRETTARFLEDARAEVREKSHLKIEEDTAWRWAARSVACHELWRETGEESWLKAAEDYRHEAIEHAAFSWDDVLPDVKRWIEVQTS